MTFAPAGEPEARRGCTPVGDTVGVLGVASCTRAKDLGKSVLRELTLNDEDMNVEYVSSLNSDFEVLCREYGVYIGAGLPELVSAVRDTTIRTIRDAGGAGEKPLAYGEDWAMMDSLSLLNRVGDALRYCEEKGVKVMFYYSKNDTVVQVDIPDTGHYATQEGLATRKKDLVLLFVGAVDALRELTLNDEE